MWSLWLNYVGIRIHAVFGPSRPGFFPASQSKTGSFSTEMQWIPPLKNSNMIFDMILIIGPVFDPAERISTCG